MAKEMGRTMFAGFSRRAKAILQSYDWPGNVRELKNTVERAVYRIAEEDEVDDIILDPFESPYRLKNQSLDTIPTANQTPDEFPVDLKEQTKAREIALIEAALKAAKYNQKTAADNLQLTYHQLRGYLKKYNLVGERSVEDGQQDPINRSSRKSLILMTTAHGFTLQCAPRRGGRVAEGAPLLREYRLIRRVRIPLSPPLISHKPM